MKGGPMLKPPIGELLEHTTCRYSLVIATSKRARQIMHGSKPLVDTQFNKPMAIATSEFHEQKVSIMDIVDLKTRYE